MERRPRLSSIAGVARAILATVGVEEGVEILVSQFGWDTAFTALSRLESEDAHAALWIAVEHLCGDAA